MTRFILLIILLFIPTTATATPLHLAIREGDTAAIQQLINAGADMQATTKNGWTPLHLAALFGYADAIKTLIYAGADMQATDKAGATPRDIAELKDHHDIIHLLKKGTP